MIMEVSKQQQQSKASSSSSSSAAAGGRGRRKADIKGPKIAADDDFDPDQFHFRDRPMRAAAKAVKSYAE